MNRPSRGNYDTGIYGDIAYQDRLERYCSYLENRIIHKLPAKHIVCRSYYPNMLEEGNPCLHCNKILSEHER